MENWIRKVKDVAVEQSFKNSGMMVKKWEPPVWEDIALPGAWASIPSMPKPRPPTTILLRSKESVPIAEGMLAVDIHRNDRFLGWNKYRKDLFHRITNIPGHHFSVFAFENLDVITDELKSACKTLVDLSRPQGFLRA